MDDNIDCEAIAETLNSFYDRRELYKAVPNDGFIDIHTEDNPFARGASRMVLEEHGAVPIKVTHTSNMNTTHFDGYRIFYGLVEADLSGFSLQ